MSSQPAVYVPKRKSLFGPVLMIMVGLAFLLVNIGKLNFGVLFVWFAKYWPLVLIAAGLVRLYEYTMARRQGTTVPGIGGGGVFMMVVVILLGLTATGMLRARDHVNWNAVREEMEINDNELSFIFGQKFEFNDSRDQAFPAGAALKVTNDRGSVKVVASPDGQLHVKRWIEVNAQSQGEADKLKNEITLDVQQSGGILEISSPRNRGARVNLEIQVPAAAALEIMTARGTVDIRDREAGVKVHNSRGDVTLENIKGNSEVHMRSGSIVARKLTGDLSLAGKVNDTTVQDVTGAVTLEGDFFSDIQLARIGKAVRFRSSRTDMELGKLDGEMHMGGGDLRATNFAGPARVVTRSKDIRFENFVGDMRVENTNGEVELHPRGPLGNVQVENRRGRIELVVPADSAFSLDATARRGDIESDFQLQTQNENHNQRATGTVGKGGAKVQLSNENGGIAIRKG